MKKNYLLAVTAVLASMFACQKVDDSIKLGTPELTLTPSGQIVLTEASKDATALTASWNDVAVEGVSVSYTFKIATANAEDYSGAFTKNVTGTSLTLSGEDLQNAAIGLGFAAGSSAQLKCCVEAVASDNTISSTTSSEVNLRVTLYTHIIVLATPVVSLSSASIELTEEGKDNVALTATWTNASVENAYVEYTFKISEASDTSYANGKTENMSTALTKSYTCAELQEWLKTKGYKEGDKADLMCCVYAESNDGTIEPVTSENATLSVTLYKKAQNANIPTSIHIVGSAVGAGWNLDDAYKFAVTDADKGLFEWTGDILNFNEFKFLANESWSIGFTHGAVGQTYWDIVYKNGNLGDNDYFRILVAGKYKFTIDAINLSMKAELIKAAAPALYLIGNGCDAGWTIADAIEIKLADDAKGLYEATVNLKSADDFKILINRVEWNRGFNRDEKSESVGTEWKLTERREDSEADLQFRVEESGSYKVTIDIVNLTFKVVKQ
ncbi:MAG: SusE domain-containing protein [Tidjanibacter sp.]|nr:SusE domain-containing protein [Tidjanibacter sp.]